MYTHPPSFDHSSELAPQSKLVLFLPGPPSEEMSHSADVHHWPHFRFGLRSLDGRKLTTGGTGGCGMCVTHGAQRDGSSELGQAQHYYCIYNYKAYYQVEGIYD